MKKYLIKDRFTGIELDKRERFDEALKLLEVYENDDKRMELLSLNLMR